MATRLCSSAPSLARPLSTTCKRTLDLSPPPPLPLCPSLPSSSFTFFSFVFFSWRGTSFVEHVEASCACRYFLSTTHHTLLLLLLAFLQSPLHVITGHVQRPNKQRIKVVCSHCSLSLAHSPQLFTPSRALSAHTLQLLVKGRKTWRVQWDSYGVACANARVCNGESVQPSFAIAKRRTAPTKGKTRDTAYAHARAKKRRRTCPNSGQSEEGNRKTTAQRPPPKKKERKEKER